jgi:uncharacterized FlaG/YvyC family protein
MADVQRSTAVAAGPVAGAAPAEAAPAGYGAQRGGAVKSASVKAQPGGAEADAAPPVAPDGARPLAQPSKDQIAAAVKDANQALSASGTQLVFVFDDQQHQMAVKLLDVQTQKVVQQVPGPAMPAKASALAAATTSGALVDTKA